MQNLASEVLISKKDLHFLFLLKMQSSSNVSKLVFVNKILSKSLTYPQNSPLACIVMRSLPKNFSVEPLFAYNGISYVNWVTLQNKKASETDKKLAAMGHFKNNWCRYSKLLRFT